jgi:hypothetical protein
MKNDVPTGLMKCPLCGLKKLIYMTSAKDWRFSIHGNGNGLQNCQGSLTVAIAKEDLEPEAITARLDNLLRILEQE